MKNEKMLSASLTILLLAGLVACTNYPVNTPKPAGQTQGYYYQSHQRQNNSEDILLLLAFSGGGTRAAAFSYGLLEALRDVTFEVDGKSRRLLDEIDVISSVSGGSVTAAAYGLYGDRIFELYDAAFLKRDVDQALMLQTLNPLHWSNLSSSRFGRSELAANYYDEILFKHASFRDLATNNSPYLIMTSTDISTGTRFSFTQHVFDVLNSDLETFPISRAVAASSAVPGVLTPVTLNNYAGVRTGPAPAWITNKYDADAGQAGRQVEALGDYLNHEKFPYLHLVDGGVSDNLGLRTYLDAISLLNLDPALNDQASAGKVRKVIFISVNAFVHHEDGWDRKTSTPGSIPVAMAAEVRLMEHYSADTLAWFRSAVAQLRRQQDGKEMIQIYAVDLNFKQLSEPSEARYFLSLPTTFHLKDDVVEKLKAAAHRLLYQNADFKKLLTDLEATAPEGSTQASVIK